MPIPKSSEYLFAYDISDNRERRQVEKLLKGYGFRRQYSVYVCRLTRANQRRLLEALEKLAIQTGFVLYVRLSHDAVIHSVGENAPEDPDAGYAYII